MLEKAATEHLDAADPVGNGRAKFNAISAVHVAMMDSQTAEGFLKGLPAQMSSRNWISAALLFLTNLCLTSFAFSQSLSAALLVLEKEDRSLAIIDPATRKIVGRVPANEDPHEVVVSEDGTRAYISTYGASRVPQRTLSVVDLSRRKPLPAVDIGPLRAPHGLDMADGKVYFTAEGSKVIGCYDPRSNEITWVLGTGQNRTHMLKVKADQSAIYSANINSSSIGFFERDQNADSSAWNETMVPVSKGPEGFDVSPDEKELWAASHEDMVTIIDIATKKVIQTMNLKTKFANRLEFTPDGKRVLVSDLGDGDLIVVDAASRKEMKRISLGAGCAGILVVPDGSVAYVAVSRDNNIAVVDLRTLSVTGHIPTGKGAGWTCLGRPKVGRRSRRPRNIPCIESEPWRTHRDDGGDPAMQHRSQVIDNH